MVIRPFSPGSDDVGRPDAVAFHALFLRPEAARRVGNHPYRLLPVFRVDFRPSDTMLDAGSLTISRPPGREVEEDPRAAAIAEAIGLGRRALVESDGPIDRLAEQVWDRLSRRQRHRRSLATWAFTDAGLFDLIGLPRLTGIDPNDRHLFVVPADPTSQASGVRC
jgi:hypothetical protein